MSNAAKMKGTLPVRLLIVGFPGAGKTGSTACLANAGYKLRVLAFDKAGNMAPYMEYCTPEGLKNIDIHLLEDKMRVGNKHFEPSGIPDSFAEALRMMDRWKYTDADGTEVDLGASKDWGTDTILVLDSLTAMGEAAMRRIMAANNKTIMNRTQQTWGVAQSEQLYFLEKMAGSANRFHIIVLAHLKMVSPKDVQKDDSELTRDLKEKAAEILPTRFYPSALGQALPPEIGRVFPTILVAESVVKHGRHKRILSHEPRAELDLKLPAKDIPSELGIEDGLLTIFQKLSGGLEQKAPSSEETQK